MTMKALLLFLALATAASTTANDKTPERMPEEVTLTSGRVLRKVSVIRWEKDRVVLKHSAGADPIAFSIIAEPLRSQLATIKEASLERKLSLILNKPTANGKSVQGQVFVVTRGAGAYKFANVRVSLYPMHIYENIASTIESKANRMDYLNPGRLAGEWEAALENTTPLVSTKTDADGKFSLVLPDERVFVFAQASRLISDYSEHYVWAREVFLTGDALNLTMENVWRPRP